LRVALYCRVSTIHQDDAAQHTELTELCERSCWPVVRTYREVVSGTKGGDRRPALKQLLLEARHLSVRNLYRTPAHVNYGEVVLYLKKLRKLNALVLLRRLRTLLFGTFETKRRIRRLQAN